MARSSDPQKVVDDPEPKQVSFGLRRLHHGKLIEDAQTELGTKRHIRAFLGPWRFLSNFWMAEMVHDGRLYLCAEAAYQAQKCARIEDREGFVGLRGGEAKTRGHEISVVSNWDDIRIEVMRSVTRAKFDQHERLREKLLATDDAVLVEGNQWRDTFWGVCNGAGHNWLGKILMDLRADYRTTAKG